MHNLMWNKYLQMFNFTHECNFSAHKILREIIYELENKSTIHKVHESLIHMPLGEF